MGNLLMEIIGLSGFARSGKDEAAKVLVEEFGFRRVAFADKLREVLYALNPIVKYEGPYDEFHRGNWRVKDVIDRFGWDGYKETGFGYEIPQLLQRMGTEAGRMTLWDSIWIDAALINLDKDDKVVVTDARFFNEFDAIVQRGGRIWRINRAGVGPANDHASELEAIDYPDFEYVIDNNGSLEDFKQTIRVHGANL